MKIIGISILSIVGIVMFLMINQTTNSIKDTIFIWIGSCALTSLILLGVYFIEC